MIEQIAAAGRLLAVILRRDEAPAQTTFVTEDEHSFQAGFIVYPANSVIARHEHLPIERKVVGTSEALLVRRGVCEVEIYDTERAHVATRRLTEGDVVLLLAGGHAFNVLEDCVLLEIKQGPYAGPREKVRY